MNLNELTLDNPIFSSLNHSQREQVLSQGRAQNIQKDEWLAHYGDIWPYLFIIEHGDISAVKESAEGRSLIVARFGTGEVFWGLAFFIENAPTPAALLATEHTKIHLWSRDQLLPILMANGKMSWELTTLMVSRMLLASDIVEGLAFQPVAGRLARLLVDRFGEREGERVSRDLTLDEMASHIGSTREMVCRLLHKFSAQGLIEITRTEFVFTDREGLNQISKKTSG